MGIFKRRFAFIYKACCCLIFSLLFYEVAHRNNRYFEQSVQESRLFVDSYLAPNLFVKNGRLDINIHRKISAYKRVHNLERLTDRDPEEEEEHFRRRIARMIADEFRQRGDDQNVPPEILKEISSIAKDNTNTNHKYTPAIGISAVNGSHRRHVKGNNRRYMTKEKRAELIRKLLKIKDRKIDPEEEKKPLIERVRWRRFIDPHTYPYIINQVNACTAVAPLVGGTIVLLILVPSAPQNFARRGLIRQTWVKAAAAANLPTITLFLLGTTEDDNVRYVIKREAEQYADIIQEDFVDSYLNLTLKTVMALRWATTFCPDATFVMKADDDVMVNIFNLTNDLSSAPHTATKRFITGRLMMNATPVRNPGIRWYTPESLWPAEKYPPYLEGHAYIMSMDIVRALLQTSITKVPLFPWEDVYIGMLLQEFGLNIIDLPIVSLNKCFRGYSNVTKRANTLLQTPTTQLALQRGYFAYDLTRESMDVVWQATQKGTLTVLEQGGCADDVISQSKRLPDLWVKLNHA